MQIPLYPLPSNPAKEIKFDMPTVQTAMAYCSVDASQEEQITTRYLNELQPQGEQWSDSAKWTAQDRRTALWWIFSNSRVDTILTSSYECKHCGDIHYVDVDMRELELTGVNTLEDTWEAFECTVKGKPYPFTIVPLNGHAMMHLESVRNQLPPEDAPNWKEEWINLRLMEVAHQLQLPNEPADLMEAAKQRYELVTSMELDTEFKPLVAAIQLFNRRTAHGLAININKGVTSLILPPHRCKAKEGEAPLTPLHMPFRAVHFLPAFRSEWLGFADE
ncbi:TPA: hypothetical protein ACGQ50_000866 [Enterobacter cloacae]